MGTCFAQTRKEKKMATKSWKERYPEISKLAESGNVTARCTLAHMYENGLGVSKNNLLACVWYKAAAESGSPEAQYRLGYLYENGLYEEGLLVEKDFSKAFHWYRKAVEQDLVPESQSNLFLLALAHKEGSDRFDSLSRQMIDKSLEERPPNVALIHAVLSANLEACYSRGQVRPDTEKTIFLTAEAANKALDCRLARRLIREMQEENSDIIALFSEKNITSLRKLCWEEIMGVEKSLEMEKKIGNPDLQKVLDLGKDVARRLDKIHIPAEKYFAKSPFSSTASTPRR